MKGDRFSKIGIQRELHLGWFGQAARLHAMGFDKRAARQEIYTYLDQAPGFSTPPTDQAKTYIANPLIKTWIAPDDDLEPLRDELFQILQNEPGLELPIQWALLGAAYPFWFEVAAIMGRLLNLQDQATQAQIVARLKERFGDRQTVSRRARYIIRSMVTWGVLKDSKVKGCYEKTKPRLISNHDLVVLMLEAALRSRPLQNAVVRDLLSSPIFFPFELPRLTGDFIAQKSPRMELTRYGLDEEVITVAKSTIETHAE